VSTHSCEAGEEEGEEEGEEAATSGGAMSSTRRATSSTEPESAVMVKLEEIQAQCNGSRHSFGYAGNPSSTCGVCSSKWEAGCGWKLGKGNWACFPCQVYICKWDCLNEHLQHGIGNTVRGECVIYTQQEATDGEMAAAQEAKKRKK
jgi:hypothetical protein